MARPEDDWIDTFLLDLIAFESHGRSSSRERKTHPSTVTWNSSRGPENRHLEGRLSLVFSVVDLQTIGPDELSSAVSRTDVTVTTRETKTPGPWNSLFLSRPVSS